MAIDCGNTQFFCRRPTKKTFFLLLLKKSKSLENRSPNKETEFFDLVDHKTPDFRGFPEPQTPVTFNLSNEKNTIQSKQIQ